MPIFLKSSITAFLFSAFCLLLTPACNSPYVPKPRGYFAISFPPHTYKPFDQPGFPYRFEYPVYANVVKDTTFFDSNPENPWWINIDFPQFGGRIYISYKDLTANNFGKLVNDAYKLTYKHTSKASYIKDSLLSTPKGIHGVFFSVGGNAATGKQFFLTDSSRHFLRGALYFDATPQADSLGIVYDFLQKDLFHLVNSFEWKKQ
jgi:gliding motility-associated lipoprotein GldD